MHGKKVGAFLLAVAFSLVGARATEIVVQRVEFSQVEQVGGREPWFETAITLSVERGSEAESANPRFTEPVTVGLEMATETERGGSPRYAFYRATAAYPTLEVGRHVVRFYLPPEVAKRDRLRGEPYAWQVTVFTDENELAQLRADPLRDQRAHDAFLARLERESAVNEGILRVQSDTPFRGASPRNTPVPRHRQAAK